MGEGDLRDDAKATAMTEACLLAQVAENNLIEFDEDLHRYTFEGLEYPSVTRILKDLGLIDMSFYTEAGLNRGTAIHTAIEYLLDGDLDWSALDERIVPYVLAFETFQRTTGFRVTHSSPTACRLADTIYRYAGTFDFAGFLADEKTPYLVDIKTGAIEPWCALQTAAYARCVPTKPIHRAGLQLREDGTYRFHPYSDPNDERIFLSAVSVWWWKNRNGGANGNM